MEQILEINRLTKTFKKQTVVDEVSFGVTKNSVYGLLGPNGAGKSTTLKMITGMLQPSSGSISFEGHTWSREDLRKIGALIETPPLYDNLTARDNLRVKTIMLGLPESRIDEVLQTVDLTGTGRKRAGQFSMGMRQRLGIAIALMRNPDFLILDEPMNGLDPAGIREMRELILKLNREKQITVLISSHILDELSRIATHYGIIRGGRLIEELGATDLEKRCHRCLKLVVEHPEKAAVALEELSIQNYDVPEPGVFRVFERLEDTAGINEALVRKGVSLKESYLAGQDLEGYFMELVGKTTDVRLRQTSLC